MCSFLCAAGAALCTGHVCAGGGAVGAGGSGALAWFPPGPLPAKDVKPSTSLALLPDYPCEQGWVDVAADGLGRASNSLPAAIFIMGWLTILLCNTANNQPATILLTRICLSPYYKSHLGEGSRRYQAALFALVMGSNLGAIYTLIGALAGIMWVFVRLVGPRLGCLLCPCGRGWGRGEFGWGSVEGLHAHLVHELLFSKHRPHLLPHMQVVQHHA